MVNRAVENHIYGYLHVGGGVNDKTVKLFQPGNPVLHARDDVAGGRNTLQSTEKRGR